MARCPFAVQKPVSAHGGPIGTILGVVIHVTAGEGDPYNEFANPNNQVSSHFGIGNGQGGMPDGQIEQYVDTSEESWAQVAGNANYISVETEGEPTDPLTPAQVAAFGRLYVWLHKVHGVPLVIVDTPGEAGFITHGDGGMAWGDHIDCPGPIRSAQRQAVLNAAAPPPVPSPTPAKESNMIARNTHGGGIWVARPNGNVYTFKDAEGVMAPYLGPLPKYLSQWGVGTAANPVTGIVDDGVGGFFLSADSGGAEPATYHITADGQYAR